MKTNNVVTVVLCRQEDGTLELYGVFKSKSKAHHSITNCMSGRNVHYIESVEHEQLLDNLNAGQEWEIVLDTMRSDDPDIKEVWGYCITDTVQ